MAGERRRGDWRTVTYDHPTRPTTCRRSGCGILADPASPDGEWCSAHGVTVTEDRAAAVAVAAGSRAFHRRR